ncbi:unnamed protein product [Aureobasidium uvarum]|uniref:F-box domain-containing protein n=1 Tax=Aureobasidium uvarum TaxID=2773716 RepID=A0A9N8PSK2_9PEZI|nr:unnamed protein product [Aureobasidium uvarum]
MARFSDLPSEIVESVVCLLELRDIRSLRLASRATEAASSQAYFQTFFLSKTIELETEAVASFAAITESSRFAVLLQDLCINGISPTLEASELNSEHVDMLSTAFLNLLKHCNQYCLRSLTVGVNDKVSSLSRNSRFIVGASAVKAALYAVRNSGLLVEKLNFLHNIKECSVPCTTFDSLLEAARQVRFSRLRSLSISLTQRFPEPDFDEEAEDELADCITDNSKADLQGVEAAINFLALASSHVEELNLHWYNTSSYPPSPTDVLLRGWFDQLSDTVFFRNLRNLTLRGLHASQPPLLKVLMSPSLQTVHLEFIRLSGSLRPILDCLTSPNRALNQFYLDDIYEEKLVHFFIQGKPKFPYSGRVPGPSTVLRKGTEVTLPLEYGYAGGRSLGSPELMRLQRRRRQDFG